MNIDIGGGEIFNPKDKGATKSNKLKQWYTTTNIPDPQGIDWIWSVVDKLQLEGVVATKLINENGIISIKNGDQNIAMQQHLEIGNLLLQVSITIYFYI